MSSVMEALAEQLGGGGLQQISRQIGADEQSVGKAVSGALPMLFGALASNSSESGGLSSLVGALDRDHDGSLLDDLGGFLGGSGAEAGGDAILGHVLGGRKGSVESSLSRSSGLDPATIAKLLALLAPMVMAALGRERQRSNLDAGGVRDLLQGERARAERNQPGLGGLASLLDADGDGSILDEVAEAGTGLLGRFLGGR